MNSRRRSRPRSRFPRPTKTYVDTLAPLTRRPRFHNVTNYRPGSIAASPLVSSRSPRISVSCIFSVDFPGSDGCRISDVSSFRRSTSPALPLFYTLDLLFGPVWWFLLSFPLDFSDYAFLMLSIAMRSPCTLLILVDIPDAIPIPYRYLTFLN